MLVIDSSIVLTSGHLGPDGTVSVVGFTCLQAGVHDLLFIDASSAGVDLQAISSAALLEYIRAFMTDPAVMKRSDAPVSGSQPPAAAGKKFCPECGTQIKEGLKFCSNCGHKMV
jgi:membrane protease subunit (stomatin/prohibitin family)